MFKTTLKVQLIQAQNEIMILDQSAKNYRIIRNKINTDNSQNENYKPVKADLFMKFYEDLNKDKSQN
jgi:hypothetical protein